MVTHHRIIIYSNRTVRTQRDVDELAQGVADRIGVTLAEMRAMDDSEIVMRIWAGAEDLGKDRLINPDAADGEFRRGRDF
jgi:hypothetical protein